MARLRRPRLEKGLAIWYLCIAAGFLLLGARAWLLGAPLWTVVLRLVIAAGFGALGWTELRAGGRA